MADYPVIDADGHIIERREDLRQYMEAPYNKRGGPLTASEPWDRSLYGKLPANQEEVPPVPTAKDWLRLLDQSEISAAYLYPTSTGNVSRVREVDYAVALCTAYNNYVYDKFAKVSDRLKPIALISPQDPPRAARELRRAVQDLGYRAGVIRTTGLRLPWGTVFTILFMRRRTDWGAPSPSTGPTEARRLPQGDSTASSKSTRCPFRWASWLSSPA